MTDIEKTSHEESPRYGFPALSNFVAADPDHETYVFRQFNNLTARNLLHLEAELLDLEEELQHFDRRGQIGTVDHDPNVALCLGNWRHVRRRAAEVDGEERKLLELAREVQRKLDEYHQALLQAARVVQFGSPSKRTVEAVKQEFHTMGIRGPSASKFDNEEDLIALKPRANSDPLSNYVRDHWPFRTKIASEHTQTFHFQEKTIQTLVSTLSVLIAAVLLTGSILTLYFVRDPDTRLGILILFILFFAIGIRVSTSASRDGIFAATAAYAAVLVVFVSGNLGTSASRGS